VGKFVRVSPCGRLPVWLRHFGSMRQTPQIEIGAEAEFVMDDVRDGQFFITGILKSHHMAMGTATAPVCCSALSESGQQALM